MKKLPLSKVQEGLLGTFTDPRTSPLFHDRFLLRWAFSVKPKADLRRLRRAHDTLVKRHDTLRLQFKRVGTHWSGHIPDFHPSGVIFEDVGDVDDATFRKMVDDRALAHMDVLESQLFQVRLMRFGRRGDVVVIRVHHILTDAYGAVLLLEEFFKLLVNFKIETHPVSHLEFVRYVQMAFAKNASVKNAYWENELLPLGPSLNSGRRRKGNDIESNTLITEIISLNGAIAPGEMVQIAARATEHGETLFNYLLASFCDVMCEDAGADNIIVCVLISRLDHKLQGYIGNANYTILVRFWSAPDKTLDDIASVVGSQMRNGLQHSPWDGFSGTGPVGTAFKENKRRPTQYMVHSPERVGRIKSSNIASALMAAKSGSLDMGAYQIARVDIPDHPPTNRELQLTIHDLDNGKSASLDADVEAYNLSELKELSQKIRRRLELDHNQKDT